MSKQQKVNSSFCHKMAVYESTSYTQYKITEQHSLQKLKDPDGGQGDVF